MTIIVEADGYTLEVEARKPFPAKFHRGGKEVMTGKWNGDFVELDPTTDVPYPHAALIWPIGVYDLLERVLKAQLREQFNAKKKAGP